MYLIVPYVSLSNKTANKLAFILISVRTLLIMQLQFGLFVMRLLLQLHTRNQNQYSHLCNLILIRMSYKAPLQLVTHCLHAHTQQDITYGRLTISAPIWFSFYHFYRDRRQSRCNDLKVGWPVLSRRPNHYLCYCYDCFDT